jgi:ABC-type uncharacterized transport system ATPase subunit
VHDRWTGDAECNLSSRPPILEQALEVASLTVAAKSEARPRLTQITLSVRRGEIVGIAGVEGNGQSELLEALLHPCNFGRRLSGMIRVLGNDVTSWRSKAIRDLGVAVVPEDRLRDALLPQAPVIHTFLLGLHRKPPFSRSGWLCLERISEAALRAFDSCDVRPRDLSLLTERLSGGNQQKIIIAREFFGQPSLVIAAQPTRGVDIGAVELIRQRIIEARDRGAGVLLVSSDLDELLALADRILVLFEGRFVAEFKRGNVSEHELGVKMGGG